MGGYGTRDLLTRYPEIFAAAIPICGGGDPSKLDAFCNKPIWAFHGDKDNVVKVSNTINVMKAITDHNCNKESKMTIVPNEGHAVWYKAIETPGLLEWLFRNKL